MAIMEKTLLIEGAGSSQINIDEYRYQETDAIQEDSCFLHQILPYDLTIRKGKELQTGLVEYQFLLRAFLEAIDQFNKGNLEKFDSLVGENACHIRAVQLALIVKKGGIDFVSLKRIEEIFSAIDDLLQSKKMQALLSGGASLQEVLENEKFLIQVTQEEVFLIRNFLLSEAREVELNRIG